MGASDTDGTEWKSRLFTDVKWLNIIYTDIIGEISAVDHFKYLKAEMTSVKV